MVHVTRSKLKNYMVNSMQNSFSISISIVERWGRMHGLNPKTSFLKKVIYHISISKKGFSINQVLLRKIPQFVWS